MKIVESKRMFFQSLGLIAPSACRVLEVGSKVRQEEVGKYNKLFELFG
jgi:hypothetical protein